MNFEVHIPKTSLGNAVDFFYLNYADDFKAQSITLPMLHQEIVFNLGDWFEVRDMEEKFSTKNYSSWATGLHTRPTKTIAKGKHLSIGILFKPWGIYQLFGVNPSLIANHVIDTNLLLGNLLEEFIRDKVSEGNFENLLPCFEDYLLKNFSQKNIKSEIIHSIEIIESAERKRGAIKRLSTELNVSSKTFIATFNSTIGLSPVKYLHLKSINQAIQQIKRYPHKSLTEIGYELGFYDQAHFIRVFKSFCNIPPKTYRNTLKIKG